MCIRASRAAPRNWKTAHLRALLVLPLVEDAVGEQRNVARAIAQRRHFQVQHVEPVSRVSRNCPASTARARSTWVAAMTRTFTTSGARWKPTRTIVFSCRKRSRIRLKVERQVADLVEEEHAVVGRLDIADLALARAGEGPRSYRKSSDWTGSTGSRRSSWSRTDASRARNVGGSQRRRGSFPVPDSPPISTGASTVTIFSICRYKLDHLRVPPGHPETALVVVGVPVVEGLEDRRLAISMAERHVEALA